MNLQSIDINLDFNKQNNCDHEIIKIAEEIMTNIFPGNLSLNYKYIFHKKITLNH